MNFFLQNSLIVVFSIKNSRKSTENDCEHSNITETELVYSTVKFFVRVNKTLWRILTNEFTTLLANYTP